MSELEHPDYANQMAEMNSFLNLHTNSPDHHQLGEPAHPLKRQTHSYPNSVSPSSPSVHSMSLVGTPKMNYDEMAFQKGQAQGHNQGQHSQGQQHNQAHNQGHNQGHQGQHNQGQQSHPQNQQGHPHAPQGHPQRFEDYSFWNDFIDDDRNSPAANTHNSHVSPTTTLPSQAKPQTHRSPANLTPPGQAQKFAGNGSAPNSASQAPQSARYPFEMKVPGITPNEIFHSPLSEPMDPQNQNLANVYDDGSFTPLVSPAVSSFDPPMSGHSLNFAMPNAFLSLDPEGQQHQVMMQQQQQQQQYEGDKKGSSSSAPPSARKRNSVAGRAAAPRGGKARSGRATPVGGTPVMGPQSGASSVAGRVAKMSPMTRPTGRASARAGSLSGPNSVGGSPLVNPLVSASGNKDSWSSDSISPESLPDIVMPPPQTRSSVSSSSSSGHMKPATPSTLMDLPKGQNEDIDMKDANSALEDAIRVTRNLTSSRSSVSLASTGATPLMSDANISPNTNISSVSSTPQIAAKKQQQQQHGKKGSVSGASSNGGSSGGSGSSKIAPQPPSRRSSSVSASPALMPKISPQIKPMMSEGSSLDYQTLLATKSNYQNIVEGKHNALGLQYPEHLSVNIASKRTSHKLAEQGRRNRINNALADLGKLLVPESASTSKANTVENAIDYIRKLKAELVEVTTKADRLQAFLQAKGLSDEFEATMGVLVKEEDKNWQGAES